VVLERPGTVALHHRSGRECAELGATSAFVTYGWGMIPVTAQIGRTGWKTSLFPKDGRYIVPVKAWVRAIARNPVWSASYAASTLI
jgi:hypothetical protein